MQHNTNMSRGHPHNYYAGGGVHADHMMYGNGPGGVPYTPADRWVFCVQMNVIFSRPYLQIVTQTDDSVLTDTDARSRVTRVSSTRRITQARRPFLRQLTLHIELRSSIPMRRDHHSTHQELRHIVRTRRRVLHWRMRVLATVESGEIIFTHCFSRSNNNYWYIYIYCCYICNQGCQRSEIVQEQGESGEMIQLYILHLYSY